jgi:hypothetical protein
MRKEGGFQAPLFFVSLGPIVLYYFYGINPLSLLHNLITVPLMGVAATALSLIGMTHPWGRPLLVLAGYITQVNVALLHTLDFGYLYPLVRPGFSEILLYYGLVMALLYVGRKRVAALLFCVLIPLCAVQVYADYRERFNTGLCIHFIDVGAGDAALVASTYPLNIGSATGPRFRIVPIDLPSPTTRAFRGFAISEDCGL